MRVCLILRADLLTPWPILRAIREVELLKSQGKEVFVVSWIKEPDSEFPPRETKEGIEIIRVPFPPPKSTVFRFPAFLKANKLLAKEAVSTKPDALLVHDLEVLRAGVIAKKRLRVPLLYHAHEDWPAMVSERSKLEAKVFSFLEKNYCRRVDHVYVPSEGVGRKYRDWGLKVTVQYASKSLAGLPRLTHERKSELRARCGLSESDFVVGLAGSLGRAEALHNILLAMKQLPSEVKLLVVGGLEEKVNAARQLATSEGLSQRVRFTGRLDAIPYMEHVGILDAGLALFIGKTLNVVHVAPIKLFDYLAMGVPVVVSDFPEMKRIVEENECGLTANSEDPHSIAKAMKTLLEQPDRRRMFSRMARESFESRFSWEKQQATLKASSVVFQQ